MCFLIDKCDACNLLKLSFNKSCRKILGKLNKLIPPSLSDLHADGLSTSPFQQPFPPALITSPFNQPFSPALSTSPFHQPFQLALFTSPFQEPFPPALSTCPFHQPFPPVIPPALSNTETLFHL